MSLDQIQSIHRLRVGNPVVPRLKGSGYINKTMILSMLPLVAGAELKIRERSQTHKS